MPQDEPQVPSTLRRSAKKIQRTYEETLGSAEAEYHDEARAHAVNATGAENVAHACARAGAALKARPAITNVVESRMVRCPSA